MTRHLVLIGLPGSGKSTVGALVADLLEMPFADLDREIERESGMSIPELFATLGEPTFRALEREAMDALLGGSATVIASGGGWAAQPGNLRGAAERAVTVYLEVAPVVVADRIAGAGNRPLLADPDPRERLEELLRARAPWYRQASCVVGAGWGSPADIASRVVSVALDGLHQPEAPDDVA
ncbi:MAG: shikimate kinase [Gemmatimonadota bacterium]|nr:shikimate kinase [Gemmatimonadota bacterium]